MSGTRPAPPMLARLLLGLAAGHDDREFLLADAREEFDRLAVERGGPAARAWYWRQAISSIRPLAGQHASSAMLRIPRPPRLPRGIGIDVQQGLRWIRRHPLTAATVVATLTLAFGATLAAYAIVHGVILSDLPFPGAERIVGIRAIGPTIPSGVRSISRPDFEDWRERATSFEALSAWAPADLRLVGRGAPRQIQAVRVAPAFDRVLGITPGAGRLFTAADYAAPPRVVVLTHRFWMREFGGNPSAIGQFLTLDAVRHEIVGVTPDLGLEYPLTPHDIWIPMVPRTGVFWEHSRGTGWLTVLGRVRAGVSLEAANAELTSVARALAAEYPDTNGRKTEAALAPVRDEVIGPVAPMLTLLAIALGAVLLVACGNIAMLLIASLAGRQREFAVRTAIGAGGARLARQVLGESLLLCGSAAVAGLVLSPVLVRVFVSMYPGRLPRDVDPAVGTLSVAAALILAAFGTVLLGGPAAWHATRIVTRSTAASGLQRTTSGRAERRLRSALVAAQVAMSFVLIVAGAAFLQTLERLTNVDTGYRAEGVLTFTLPPSPTLGSGAAVIRFYDDVVRAISALPQVKRAGSAVSSPLMTSGWNFNIRPRGATADVLVGVNLASQGYFDALGIRLRQGRYLTDDEQQRGERVAVVNEPLAKLLGGDVVGTRLTYSRIDWQIVGVVEGVRRGRPRDEPSPELIIPWHMAGPRTQTVVVHTEGDPLAMLPAVTARIHAIDPTAALTNASRLEDRLRDATAMERFRATLLAALALVAVGLASLGAYSVSAYAVARRTREYGIRLALGERPQSIGTRALGTAVVPAVAGLLCGVPLVIASSAWLQSFLFGVTGTDPLTLSAAAAGLLGLALIAGASSARRAASIDPAAILIQD